MKKLDSLFICDFSDKKKKIGLINLDMEQHTLYLGAPRNSDGTPELRSIHRQ